MGPLPFFRKASTDSNTSISSASSTSSSGTIKQHDLASLTNPSSTTLQSQLSIPYSGRISPTQAAKVGWGKVVAEGGYLSVHTLGVLNGKESAEDFKRHDSSHVLQEIRALMKKEPEPLDYYIIPSEDAHQSEFVAPCDKRREFVSGFTGSCGTAVISHTEALLFVDARYYAQADRQLDKNWRMKKVGQANAKDWVDWLGERPPGSIVGIDSRLVSHETATKLTTYLLANGSRIKFPRLNLVDVVWKQRPPKPNGQIYIREEKYAGQPATEKIAAIQAWIKTQKPYPNYATANAKAITNGAKPQSTMSNIPTATIISNLSSVAWLLNLRGSDLPFTPVFHAYLFISTAAAVLFVDRKKLTPDVEMYLKSMGVVLRDYGEVFNFLRTGGWGAGRVLIDAQTPYVISLMLSSPRYMLASSYGEEKKALKNETEIAGFRAANLRDGAAMVRWFAWLDEKMTKHEPVSEWGASQKLNELKRENQEFVGPAYENICATGPNAALPHYTPTRTDALLIDHRTPFLADAGGQYFNGTCDTSRTYHFGNPTAEQCEAYTKVLKGHIAIDSVVFPEGTTGAQLDVLARRALWQDGMNYEHSTGHGVGSFLSVHEGPHGFSQHIPLEPGHVITNEPGFYKEGQWGMRIESTLLVRRVETKGEFGGKIWLGFDRFTMVPIQTKMIKVDMLTKEERAWVRAHNSLVRQSLAPFLQDDKRALRWLKRECSREGPPPTAAGVKLEWD